eukprot:CAMPEP_0196133314 /NCGR_PEP_ID=MMETSP0910-20130528/2587_1 /TAXON_ID=49265 /ORGANISM="Thalassiosira rotula, Strain GSO102" /LENGTH=364 /DNA_ID=CAMNT_0041393025 /DNA_START=62 /DNA_END=1153 /DNA_ORIENTATION=+
MASSNDDWCTIESDPGVFTSLIESFGTQNVEFAELWSLDDDSLLQLIRPMEGVENAAVHGLIFLFKWQSSSSSSSSNAGDVNKEEEGGNVERGKALVGDDCPEGLFFAKQVTDNACATQAILSVLFNAPNSIIQTDDDDADASAASAATSKTANDDDNGRKLILGKTLSNFKSFTSHFPPDLRGEAIGSSDEIRAAHNSFGRAEDAFLSDPSRAKRAATDDDDVFHFIAYVPHEGDGCVYELDGLQAGPIRVGSYRPEIGDENTTHDNNNNGDGGTTSSDMDWIRVARNAIQTRLASYSSTEIKFNLMAVVQDKRTYLTERLNALAAIGVEESDPNMLAVRSELHGEEEKRAGWASENERRRHN